MPEKAKTKLLKNLRKENRKGFLWFKQSPAYLLVSIPQRGSSRRPKQSAAGMKKREKYELCNEKVELSCPHKQTFSQKVQKTKKEKY